MRILFIAQDIGVTAQGIVFEKILHGLEKFHTIDVLTSLFSPRVEFKNLNNIIIKHYYHLPFRVHQACMEYLRMNPMDALWGYVAAKKIKDSYDLIFSFISYFYVCPLNAGRRLINKKQCKYAIYSVDAIPPPGWPGRKRVFTALQSIMYRYLGDADYFAAINNEMLNYQLTTFRHKEGLISDTIFIPTLDKDKKFEYNNNYTFLYTGGIYNPRKVKYLFGALKKVLLLYPQTKLVFVGNQYFYDELVLLSEEERKCIEIYPYTRDLDPFYERSAFLLDIDPDIENDLFLSSKMTNYLRINRIIVCETGINSPSRHLFKGIPSIIQCGHNKDELYYGMLKAIENFDKVDFADRKDVLKLFDSTKIIEKLNESLSKLVHTS